MAWDRGLKMARTDGYKHNELTSIKDAVGKSGQAQHELKGQFHASYTHIWKVLLTLHVVTGYKMYPGLEFSCTFLAGTEKQS
jgi:hypothetical protein